MVPANYGVNGCWAGLRLKQEAFNRYAPDDPRAAFFWTDGQTDTVTTISSFNTGIPAPKFVNKTSGGADGSDLGFADTDFPVFRLADAYLIYAEAHLRGGGGDPAQALAYLNAIRERAYGNTSADVPADSLTLGFVLNERGRELLWEAHRRTDLIRYGLFTGGDYVWAWKGGAPLGTATESVPGSVPAPGLRAYGQPEPGAESGLLSPAFHLVLPILSSAALRRRSCGSTSPRGPGPPLAPAPPWRSNTDVESSHLPRARGRVPRSRPARAGPGRRHPRHHPTPPGSPAARCTRCSSRTSRPRAISGA